VSIYSATPIAAHSLLGTKTLDATGKVTWTTSSLPLGSNNLFAVFNGNSTYAVSTSLDIVQVVLARPGRCDDTYNNWFYGSSTSQIQGSSGNNFFWVPNGSYQVDANNGNNCFWGGDGNNHYSGGSGRNHVTCGNGNNTISLGGGPDDVQVDDGTNQILLGNGNDTVTVGSGGANRVTVGNGNDTVTVRSGSSNVTVLGSGADTVFLGESHNSVSGAGHDTVYLGGGTGNTFVGTAGQKSLCHLPTPPPHGMDRPRRTSMTR
jgi:Ca2+-binding RTX toxin-like protein